MIRASLEGVLEIAQPSDTSHFPMMNNPKCDFVHQVELKEIKNGRGIFSYKCLNGQKGLYGITEDQQEGIHGKALTWAHNNGLGKAYWNGWEEAEKIASQPKMRIGLGMEPVNPTLVRQYSLRFGEGIFVNAVMDGGPSAKAGLQVGDVIIAINSTSVTSEAEFDKVFAPLTVNDKLVFTIYRKGRLLEVPVKGEPIN